MATLNGIMDYLADANTIESITLTITSTTGTYNTMLAYKIGHIVFMHFVVKNSSQVASGNNIFVGKIDQSAYYPKTYVKSCDYDGAKPIISTITNNGAITVRNASSSTVSANVNVTVAVCMLVD